MKQAAAYLQHNLSLTTVALLLLSLIAALSLAALLAALRRNRRHKTLIDAKLQLESSSLSTAIEELIQRSSAEGMNSTQRNQHMQIADISHDLRTPLTAIQGYLETLINLGESLSAEERKEYAQIALRNTQAVIQQIKDLLNVFKDPRKEDVVCKDMFSLTELFEELYGRFHPSAEQKKLRFEALSTKSDVSVLADRKLIERAISNFIANAIRYTPESGHVRISARMKDQRVRIAVEDNGIGIPEQDLPHICNRFYRVNKDRSRSTGGSGLGLSIASDILEKHNADLKVTSEAGKGTTWTFSLDIVLE